MPTAACPRVTIVANMITMTEALSRPSLTKKTFMSIIKAATLWRPKLIAVQCRSKGIAIGPFTTTMTKRTIRAAVATLSSMRHTIGSPYAAACSPLMMQTAVSSIALKAETHRKSCTYWLYRCIKSSPPCSERVGRREGGIGT